MKVLLTQSVKNLGHAGDVRAVADGYARNYLIPRGFATVATASALRQAEVQHEIDLRRERKFAAENQSLAARVGQITVTLRAKVGSQNRLYGAITANDIATALGEKLGTAVDRRNVQLGEPIRHLGDHKVAVRIARDLTPEVTVVVEAES
ncbi:MAG: 50S ribosomal protein L9 [Chloroflexota bacterium]|nr:MAG: 50S ribosomal protein L9 [Chloroflexota bacterium]